MLRPARKSWFGIAISRSLVLSRLHVHATKTRSCWPLPHKENSAWGRVFLMSPCGNCRRRGFRMLLCAAQSITSVMKTKSARKKQAPITAF